MNHRRNRYSDRPTLKTGRPSIPVPGLLLLSLPFSGALAVIGWLFLGIGGLLGMLFVGMADLTSWYEFRGELAQTQGMVIRTERTNISEGSSGSGQHAPIYRVFYEYRDATNTRYARECYTQNSRFTAGDLLPVEYRADRPTLARVPGTRQSPFPALVAFVLVFPLIGIILVALEFKQGLQRARVLRLGRFARGRLVERQATSTKINNQPVYRLIFEFEDERGATHRAEARTHKTAALMDDREERLLYDPANPTRAVLLDSLPGRVVTDERGNVTAWHIGAAPLALLLPVIGIGSMLAGFLIARMF